MLFPIAAFPRHHLICRSPWFSGCVRISLFQIHRSCCTQRIRIFVSSVVWDTAQYSLKSSTMSMYGAASRNEGLSHWLMNNLALPLVELMSLSNCCIQSTQNLTSVSISGLAALASRHMPISSTTLNTDPVVMCLICSGQLFTLFVCIWGPMRFIFSPLI